MTVDTEALMRLSYGDRDRAGDLIRAAADEIEKLRTKVELLDGVNTDQGLALRKADEEIKALSFKIKVSTKALRSADWVLYRVSWSDGAGVPEVHQEIKDALASLEQP